MINKRVAAHVFWVNCVFIFFAFPMDLANNNYENNYEKWADKNFDVNLQVIIVSFLRKGLLDNPKTNTIP